MSEFTQRRSAELFEKGLTAVECGDYVTALHQFRAATYVQRTLDALVHWGSMEHYLGDTQKAIELCRDAIRINPDSGSPYNDIGTYLVVLGRLDEAVPWFKRAIASREYGPRHYPHINLGKVYLARKQNEKALEHFQEALRIDPFNEEVRDLIATLEKKLS